MPFARESRANKTSELLARTSVINWSERRGLENFIVKKRRYNPVGWCIYCGSAEGKLSDEHIIPLGLAGPWILPKASCQRCAKITSQVEQFCLRPMLGNFRLRMQFPTRHKKQRPDQLFLEFVDAEGRKHFHPITADTLPLVCIGYRFHAPELLRGKQPSNQFEGALIARFVEQEIKQLAPSGKERLKFATVNDLTFSRMLAKIAHAYAMAELGAQAFRPLLPAIILGHSSQAPFLIGGDESPMSLEPQPSILHHLYFQNCRTGGVFYTLVAVRLFACMGMPRYHVVVGETVGAPMGEPMAPR